MFDEHRIDAQFVKYQSVINSSWLIGFDTNGNPLNGGDQFIRDGSPRALKLERCYHFRKENKLDVAASYFPEAEKILQESGVTIRPIKPMSSLEASIRGALRVQSSKTQQVHSFEQRQLLNMTRYRAIQWAQIDKALKEIKQTLNGTINQSDTKNSNNNSNNNN